MLILGTTHKLLKNKIESNPEESNKNKRLMTHYFWDKIIGSRIISEYEVWCHEKSNQFLLLLSEVLADFSM